MHPVAASYSQVPQPLPHGYRPVMKMADGGSGTFGLMRGVMGRQPPTQRILQAPVIQLYPTPPGCSPILLPGVPRGARFLMAECLSSATGAQGYAIRRNIPVSENDVIAVYRGYPGGVICCTPYPSSSPFVQVDGLTICKSNSSDQAYWGQEIGDNYGEYIPYVLDKYPPDGNIKKLIPSLAFGFGGIVLTWT